MLQKMRRLNTSLPRRRDQDAVDHHQGVGLEVVGTVGRELHFRKGWERCNLNGIIHRYKGKGAGLCIRHVLSAGGNGWSWLHDI